jgi:hypothetical protein
VLAQAHKAEPSWLGFRTARPASLVNTTLALSSLLPASALTSAALTILCHLDRPETPPQPSCFVPFRRDLDFVDRGTLLDQLRERCAAPAACVALVGLGRVG